MAKKKVKKEEKMYSFEEYRKTFYPNPALEQKISPQDPRIFGRRLAEEAMKKVAEPQSK